MFPLILDFETDSQIIKTNSGHFRVGRGKSQLAECPIEFLTFLFWFSCGLRTPGGGGGGGGGGCPHEPCLC